jgi:CheY-like chemotaxis protein
VGVRPFEILVVADSELVAQAVAAALRRAGHHVTAATTIAGAVETLMRRGPDVDMILTSTPEGSALGDDAMYYGKKLAAHAALIPLSGGNAVELARVLADRRAPGWN